MSLRNLKSARTMHPLDSLFSPALLSRFFLASAPAGPESVGDGGKSRTIMAVDDLLDERPVYDAIPTGSPAVAEKLPAWEANARVVLAGAKRWAQQRWGRS